MITSSLIFGWPHASVWNPKVFFDRGRVSDSTHLFLRLDPLSFFTSPGVTRSYKVGRRGPTLGVFFQLMPGLVSRCFAQSPQVRIQRYPISFNVGGSSRYSGVFQSSSYSSKRLVHLRSGWKMPRSRKTSSTYCTHKQHLSQVKCGVRWVTFFLSHVDFTFLECIILNIFYVSLSLL